MAAESLLAEYPELRPFLLSNHRPTGIRIGAGAYGSVDEVAVPGAIYAAKKIHDIFLYRSEIPAPEIRRVTAQFVRECQLMSTLNHPNIVKFIGVAFFHGSRLPALVMERLLTSLHDLLDPETDPPLPPKVPKPFFPLSLKCSILLNVACGLAYLHEQSPPIIHRDLSARNVLLNSRMVAKIVDLGVARIVLRMRAAATMTKGPGASVYMPPEATAPAASNTLKSNEIFPCDPLAYTYVDEETGLLVARSELQRCSEYMFHVNEQLRACGQLCGDHPLLRLIQGCLHNVPHKRPNINEVLHLLEEARARARDQSLEREPRPQVQELQQQLQSKCQENSDLQSRVQAKDRELAETQQQLRQKEEELIMIMKEAELTRAEESITQEQQLIQEMRQHEIKLSKATNRSVGQKGEQLKSSEAQVADVQETLEQRTSETLRTRTVQFCRKKTTPCGMARGSATSDGQYAYLSPGGSTSIYQYECRTEKWEELPSCPYRNSGLVIIDRKLTAVGGEKRSGYTNKVSTLRNKKWVETYPPMKTGCSTPAVLVTSDGDYLIVIGGYNGHFMSAAQLLHINSRKWYKLTDLPQPLSNPSATLCGDLIGDGANGYTCSFRALLSSEIPPQSMLHLVSWISLPPLPVTDSTAATLCGQLVLIGGVGKRSPVNSIHQLADGQWVMIGSMAHCRSYTLVASPSPYKMIIVGGWGEHCEQQDSVEELTIVDHSLFTGKFLLFLACTAPKIRLVHETKGLAPRLRKEEVVLSQSRAVSRVQQLRPSQANRD